MHLRNLEEKHQGTKRINKSEKLDSLVDLTDTLLVLINSSAFRGIVILNMPKN